jgi:hypothetical protein
MNRLPIQNARSINNSFIFIILQIEKKEIGIIKEILALIYIKYANFNKPLSLFSQNALRC